MTYLTAHPRTSALLTKIIFTTALSALATAASAADSDPAYIIDGKITTIGDLKQAKPTQFYTLDKEYADAALRKIREITVDNYWQKQAKAAKRSITELRAEAMDKRLADAGINDLTVRMTAEQRQKGPGPYRDMPKAGVEKDVREGMVDTVSQKYDIEIFNSEIKNGTVVVSLKYPQPPVLDIKVSDDEPTLYGPEATDTVPQGCKGKDCPVTIVEYSEFECPYCAQSVKSSKVLREKYKGKLRWIVRDFPLEFHARAKPAAIAAHCAKAQDKYWPMYFAIFANQKALADSDFVNHAKQIGLDVSKFESCYKKPGKIVETIEANLASGIKLDVQGTPSFFINGRPTSATKSQFQFEAMIEQELKAHQKN